MEEKEVKKVKIETEALKETPTLKPLSVPQQFKLHLFLPNGMVRPQIPSGVHMNLARKWGDIIRCIPSNRWSTMDEIANLVWDFEKKSYLKDFSRTRKQIEDAVIECADAGVVLVR